MFNFFGRSKAPSESSVVTPPKPAPELPQISVTQREMARMALLNVLKHHGIPSAWITGEMTLAQLPNTPGSIFLLQLEVLKWHDGLMRYAPALEQALLDGFMRFDPNADKARYRFTWKFSPQCGCPHTTMPDPAFWQSPPTAPLAAVPDAAPAAPAKPKFDLPDHDDDDADHGFASTQIQAK